MVAGLPETGRRRAPRKGRVPPLLRIAAALIDDGNKQLMFVRKAGTSIYMQAGGKIEAHEDAWTALARELLEEIGLDLGGHEQRWLGIFRAPAANEPGSFVEAHLYHVRAGHETSPSAEIEEVIWASIAETRDIRLAPLSRRYVLPLAIRMGLAR